MTDALKYYTNSDLEKKAGLDSTATRLVGLNETVSLSSVKDF